MRLVVDGPRTEPRVDGWMDGCGSGCAGSNCAAMRRRLRARMLCLVVSVGLDARNSHGKKV